MTRLKVGGLYFLIVFAGAFVLGAFRELFLEPQVGKTWAVLIEVPLLIVFSWVISWRLLKKFELQGDCLGAMVVGGSAFVFLVVTEFMFSLFVLGQSSDEFLESLRCAPGVIGLLGQVFFGLIPFLQVASVDGDCKELVKKSDSEKV